MDGLHSSSPSSVFTISLVITAILLCSVPQGANGDCNLETAEEGSKFCRKAFEDTYKNNKLKVVEHPKKTGCCLSYNMGDCVKYAFTAAKCSPEDQEVAGLVKDKVEEAQSEINKGASYIGSFICGDQNRAKCGHLVDEYDKAKVQIDALNGAYSSALVTPFLAVTCSLLALLFS